MMHKDHSNTAWMIAHFETFMQAHYDRVKIIEFLLRKKNPQKDSKLGGCPQNIQANSNSSAMALCFVL